MHDFKDVLTYNLDRRRRSPTKQPAKPPAVGAGATDPDCNKAPVRKPAAAKPRLTPDLSPKSNNVKMPSSTGGAHQGKGESEDCQDHSAPKSTARHPAPSAAAAAAGDDTNEAPDTALRSPVSAVDGTSAVASGPLAVTAPTATALKSRPYVTPAHRGKAIQTPSSKPSTSRNHAALADGQFQPTPLPTATPSATVIATAAHPKNGNIDNTNFRSPQPRTVFVNKKRAANSMEESKIGGSGTNNNNTSSIARLATSSSPVAVAPKVHSAGRSNKKQQTVTANREPMESLSLNLNQYEKGPTLKKPDACPPLFKASASTGVLGKPKRHIPEMPPLPAPSAQKASQAAALSGQFFSQEKELIAFMSDKHSKKETGQKHQHSALVPRLPMPLVVPATAPLQLKKSAAVPATGSSLKWAFSTLKQQHDQRE